MVIWLESQWQHKPLTSELNGSPNPARNTYGHYAAFKLAANTGAQALHVLTETHSCPVITDYSSQCFIMLPPPKCALSCPRSLPECSHHHKTHLQVSGEGRYTALLAHPLSLLDAVFQVPTAAQTFNPSAN